MTQLDSIHSISDTIIINQSDLSYKKCCEISERNFNIYSTLVNEIKVLKGVEKSNIYSRSICTPYHPFKMIFYDENQNEIIELNKPYKCFLIVIIIVIRIRIRRE